MNKRTLLLTLLGIAVAIQFVPVERDNPPVESEIPAPPLVRTILEQSCFDCHSHETDWPWYSHVAPVSWLIAHDVEEGREHLNMSRWNDYDSAKQRGLREEIWEEVEEGEMPRWFYLPLHPEAALDEAEKELLRYWALGGGTGALSGLADVTEH
jgi:hypothetical protein